MEGGAEKHSGRGKEGWATGWLCHHLPPALQLCPLRQDRWLVAALLLLTSALFLSPFPIPLSPAGIVHSPPAPRRSISWCSGALTVPALYSPLPLLPSTSILPDIERGAAGHSHWRWANSGPFQFFIGVIWPSSSMREGRGCPFDF